MKINHKTLIWASLVLLSFLFFLRQLSFVFLININGIQSPFHHNVYGHYYYYYYQQQQQQSLSSVIDPNYSAPLNVEKLHRTGYHFQPQKHWINDPTGPMYYRGLYHLFYQYNPKGAVWGNIVWGHSVSKDLINWESLEPAIYPSKPFDKYGCWSGSATILPGDKPIILYTGVINPDPKPGHQVQNYAVPANYSDPYLREWIKPDDNPIISPVSGENLSQFRDPTTAWFENGHWNVLVGGVRRNSGIAHLYRSKDFKTWTKARHHFYSKPDTGMWECLDFYPVAVRGTNGLDNSELTQNVKHVLKVSLDLTRYDCYTLGTYNPINDKYVPDDTMSLDGWRGLRYDYGNFYASKTFYDPAMSRRILWGWANESDNATDDIAKGWAGIQLIPRTLWLDPSGKQLLQWPIEELNSLRGEKVELSNIQLKRGHHREVDGLTAAQADVDVMFSFSSLDKAEPFDPSWAKLDALDVCSVRGSTVEGGIGPFGLLTLASNNLEEYTPVFFRVFKADEDLYKILLCSDAKSSSLTEGLYKPSFAGYVDVDLTDKKLSLRSLIDHSVVESFGAGGKTCISSRVYPTLAVFDDAHLHVFNNGSEIITVERLEAWSMNKPYQMN